MKNRTPMRRRTELKRSGPPKRKREHELSRGRWNRSTSRTWEALDDLPISKGVGGRKARDEARKVAEFERKYGSLERVFYFQTALCCLVPNCPRQPEVAHGRGGGTGRKGEYEDTNPLCSVHHRTHVRSFHNLGSVDSFEAEWLVPQGTTWAECAARSQASFESASGQLYIKLAKEDGRFDEWRRRAA